MLSKFTEIERVYQRLKIKVMIVDYREEVRYTQASECQNINKEYYFSALMCLPVSICHKRTTL